MTRLPRLRPPAWTAPADAAAATARGPRCGRRGAKVAVLSGLAFVVVLNLGLNVALDTVMPEWRDPEYGHRMKDLRRQAAAAGPRPVVAVLGSSRTEMGLSPAHMGFGDGPDVPLVYNVSQAGCGPVGELLNLKRLLADGVTPDFVLVEILPPVLAGSAPAERLLVPHHLGYGDLDRVEPYLADPASYRRDWLASRVNPWSTYRIELLSHCGAGGFYPWQARVDHLWRQLKPGGWLPYFYETVEPQKRAEGTAKARAEYAPYFTDFRVAETPDRAYRDLIALCRARGIRVGFHTMPESATFRSWYSPDARAAIDAYFAGLRREFGVPVFDCSGWLPDDADYADGHHLLRRGAVAFSERFGRECVGPWLRGE